MKLLLATILVALSALGGGMFDDLEAQGATAIIYSVDGGGSGGTYWQNSGVFCDPHGRQFWAYVVNGRILAWRCAFRDEL